MGRKQTEETKKKISIAKRGKPSPFKGNRRYRYNCLTCNKLVKTSHKNRKYCSLECFYKTRKGALIWGGKRPEVNKFLKPFQFEKGNKSHTTGKTKENYHPLMKSSKAMKKVFRDNPNMRKKLSKNMKNGGALKARKANNPSPNNPEKKLIKFFDRWDIPLKYVGNNKKWIITEEGHFNPDFIDEDKKIIVEFDGKYWHSLNKEKDERRNKAYNEQGYKLLILNEEDISDNLRIMNKVGSLAR